MKTIKIFTMQTMGRILRHVAEEEAGEEAGEEDVAEEEARHKVTVLKVAVAVAVVGEENARTPAQSI